MRKHLKAVALAAGLVALGAGRADAQFVWSGCGGAGTFPPGGFNTCASVNISWSSNVLTMVVQNWGTYNPATASFCTVLCGSSVFTQLGIQNFGSGSLTGLTSTSCVNDADCAFTFDSNLGGLPGFAGAGANPPPTSHGLNPPGTSGPGLYSQVTFTFSTTGTIDLSQATFGLHGQAGPSDCSTKLFVTNDNGSYTNNSTALTNCVGTPNTPVPEPMSMVLVATGLVGLGGAGLLRRRRKV